MQFPANFFLLLVKLCFSLHFISDFIPLDPNPDPTGSGSGSTSMVKYKRFIKGRILKSSVNNCQHQVFCIVQSLCKCKDSLTLVALAYFASATNVRLFFSCVHVKDNLNIIQNYPLFLYYQYVLQYSTIVPIQYYCTSTVLLYQYSTIVPIQYYCTNTVLL